MSGILFILDVIAFWVVVYWAYANDPAGGGGRGDKGLLALKQAPSDGAPQSAARPRWSRGAVAARPEDDLSSPTPGWRRGVARRQP